LDISNLSLNESRFNNRLKTTAGPSAGAFYQKAREFKAPTLAEEDFGFDDDM
jgi:hypothetical protein